MTSMILGLHDEFQELNENEEIMYAVLYDTYSSMQPKFF